jgi:hypothetical protein
VDNAVCRHHRIKGAWHPHSTPSTPLLLALTLRVGECKVSGGESNVSRQVGLSSQNGLPLFLVAFSGLLLCRHGEATGFLLRVYDPCRCLRDGYRIWVCRPRLFCLSRPLYLNTVSLLRSFPPPHHHHGKKEDHWRRAKRSCQSK